MKFRIAEDEYEVESVDRLTLAHFMRIEKETAALGKPMKWGEVRALVERVSGLEPKDAVNDDDFPWLVGIIVWAARVDAGDRALTLADAVDFPMGDLEFINDNGAEGPQDHQAAGGRSRPRKPRPGSGRGGAAAARARATTSPSATPSSDD